MGSLALELPEAFTFTIEESPQKKMKMIPINIKTKQHDLMKKEEEKKNSPKDF